MTRINVVPVKELTDQHLLAETRELPRIPNAILKGRYNLSSIPSEYVLGKGHVSFFYTRLGWLQERYKALHAECCARGFNVTYRFPEGVPERFRGGYVPTSEALAINRERILVRWPKKAKYYGKNIDSPSVRA